MSRHAHKQGSIKVIVPPVEVKRKPERLLRAPLLGSRAISCVLSLFGGASAVGFAFGHFVAIHQIEPNDPWAVQWYL
jgi:hypothetical protein